MGRRKAQICFGAINTWDRTPHVYSWTVAGTKTNVREVVGDAYKEADDETKAQGWERARKAGMRVVKIEVRII